MESHKDKKEPDVYIDTSKYKKLSLTQVIEVIQNELSDFICPLSLTVPLIPYTAKKYDSMGRFTPDNFELGQLLNLLLIQKHTRNPMTRKPISIQDIGTELVPNFKLIKKVDDILNRHDYNREDLLKYYGLSNDLYQRLLNFKSSDSHIFNIAALILLGGILAGSFYSIFSTYYRAGKFDTKIIENIYRDVLATFEPLSLSMANDKYDYKISQYSFMLDNYKYSNYWLSYYALPQKYYFGNLPNSCMQITARSIPIASSPPGGDTISLRQFYYNDIFMQSAILLCALAQSIASTFMLERSYNQAKYRKQNMGESILTKTIFLSTLIIGIDAITDCLGIVSSFDITQEAVYDACARACNDGLSVKKYFPSQNVTYTYTMPNEPAYTDNTSSFLNTTLAGLWHTAIPLFGNIAARKMGKYFQRNVPEDSEKLAQDFKQLEKENYDYINRRDYKQG